MQHALVTSISANGSKWQAVATNLVAALACPLWVKSGQRLPDHLVGSIQ